MDKIPFRDPDLQTWKGTSSGQYHKPTIRRPSTRWRIDRQDRACKTGLSIRLIGCWKASCASSTKGWLGGWVDSFSY